MRRRVRWLNFFLKLNTFHLFINVWLIIKNHSKHISTNISGPVRVFLLLIYECETGRTGKRQTIDWSIDRAYIWASTPSVDSFLDNKISIYLTNRFIRRCFCCFCCLNQWNLSFVCLCVYFLSLSLSESCVLFI